MKRRINEQDEFLLSRFLDGDLSTEEAAALGKRIEKEPDMRRAYESLKRIDELISDHYSDKPEINWKQFRAEVAEVVKEQAVSQRERGGFAGWLRIGVPLAAAAAIALVISFYPSWPQPGELNRATPSAQVFDTVADNNHGGQELVVRFNRNTPSDDGRESVIKVSYTRSEQAEARLRKNDEAAQERLSYVAVAAIPLSSPMQEALMEMSPL